MKKIKVTYYKKIDGEWFAKTQYFDKYEDAFEYMSHLADKYLLPEYSYTYEKSLFSMKPILKSSEVDDSRPTTIRVSSMGPKFVSVLSGKINTVYDLDEVLDYE